jgi:hypothetical protein
MNSWKLNGRAGHLTRQAIINSLNITDSELYKTVKSIYSINNINIIETQDGKKYTLILKEITDDIRKR